MLTKIWSAIKWLVGLFLGGKANQTAAEDHAAATSVANSTASETQAHNAVQQAAADATKPGTSNDVFGSEGYKEKK